MAEVGSPMSSAVPRFVGGVAATLTTLLTAVTLIGAVREPRATSIVYELPAWLAVLGVVGVGSITIAAWLAGIERPRASVGLAVAAAGLLLPLWAGWTWLPADARAAVLAAAPLAVAGFGHVSLAWTAETQRSHALGVVYVLAGAGSLVYLVGYDPFSDPACTRTCAHVEPLARPFVSTRSALAVANVLTLAAASIAAAAVIWARQRPPRSVAGAVVVSLGLLATAAAIRSTGWAAPLPTIALLLPSAIAASLTGVATVAAFVALRQTRSAVQRLVARLGDPTLGAVGPDGTIRDVQFAVLDESRWVDARGRPVGTVPPDAQPVVLSDPSGPVLRLLVEPGRDMSDVLAGVTPATRLALRNAQLVALTNARVADVQASRRRVVVMSDAERRRIERDLHDGAQQRLVSATFYLAVARARITNEAAILTRAEATVHEALTKLRRLAHGIFPSVLATEGLRPAVEELARASDAPVTLEFDDAAGVSPDAAMAAYATVARALDHAVRASAAGDVRVVVARREGVLLVSVTYDVGEGGNPDFADVGDRVAAVGGRLTLATTTMHTTVTAALPCESS